MKRESFSNQIFDKAHHHISLPEHVDYRADTPSGLIACSACGAVFFDGRWQWLEIPASELPLTRCPSCTRVYQKKPAGYVTLQGDFAQDHHHEMLKLIHHIETREKMHDPLQRIMWIDYQEDGTTVTTTHIQLTHMIGEALKRAYKGKLDYHFNESEDLLFLRWKR